MRFSTNWLQQWIDIPADVKKLAAQLTSLGFEVESIADGHILEVTVPPNRGDCLSISGLAKELSALSNKMVTELSIEPVPPTIDNTIAVNIHAAEACPRYIGREIRNININAPTPDWMQNILQQAGIKTISAVVDITNYVMLELGQPLHAFDLDQILHCINVRYAKIDETLVLLDGKKITLNKHDLVISDNKQVLALAGIIGGEASAISANTKNIFLECAYFEPIGIRKSSQEKAIYTDSSHRFERIVSPDLQARAMERVTQLILDIAGGKPGPVVVEENYKYLPKVKTIDLRRERIQTLLGMQPRDKDVENIFSKLGIKYSFAENGWQVKVPLARQDLAIEADLIEEIARFIGYDNIPEEMPLLRGSFKNRAEGVYSSGQAKLCLKYRGYAEVITYSFIDPYSAKQFAQHSVLELVNPISADMAVMRPSLLPGLVKVLQYNQNRQQSRLKIFEVGLKFITDDKIIASKRTHQIKTIAGLCAGTAFTEHWGMPKQPFDFFDIKGDVEALLKLANLADVRFVAATDLPMLHPQQAAKVFNGSALLGYMGVLHPQLVHELDLQGPVLVFELELVNLIAGSGVVKFKEISKFPLIRRDINLVIAETTEAAQICKVVNEQAVEILHDLQVIDIYKGTGITSGNKSITLSLLLQHPSRTLKDDEVNEVLNRVLASLKTKCQAVLREQ